MNQAQEQILNHMVSKILIKGSKNVYEEKSKEVIQNFKPTDEEYKYFTKCVINKSGQKSPRALYHALNQLNQVDSYSQEREKQEKAFECKKYIFAREKAFNNNKTIQSKILYLNDLLGQLTLEEQSINEKYELIKNEEAKAFCPIEKNPREMRLQRIQYDLRCLIQKLNSILTIPQRTTSD